MNKKNLIFDYTSTTFDAYQNSLKKNPRLSADEERELGKRIRQGDTQARNKLVEANLLFVIDCAKKFSDYQVPLEELIAAGNCGLVAAAERYDPTYENRFISYAVRKIMQSMYDVVNDYRQIVHIPSNKLKEMNYHYATLDVFRDAHHDEDDDYCPCLQNKLHAEPTTSQTELLLDEEREVLRHLLSQHFFPIEVNFLMDYAQMRADGYKVEDLAKKYRLPLNLAKKKLKVLRDKIDALHLHAAYLKQAAWYNKIF